MFLIVFILTDCREFVFIIERISYGHRLLLAVGVGAGMVSGERLLHVALKRFLHGAGVLRVNLAKEGRLLLRSVFKGQQALIG